MVKILCPKKKDVVILLNFHDLKICIIMIDHEIKINEET